MRWRSGGSLLLSPNAASRSPSWSRQTRSRSTSLAGWPERSKFAATLSVRSRISTGPLMPKTSERRSLLLDTHVWLWLEAGSDELAPRDRGTIASALGVGRLHVASISLWELALLASRRRVVLGQPTNLWF